MRSLWHGLRGVWDCEGLRCSRVVPGSNRITEFGDWEKVIVEALLIVLTSKLVNAFGVSCFMCYTESAE